MKTIWKFPLIVNNSTIWMPKGAEILTVQNQNETACLWALVDTTVLTEARHIQVFGTGDAIPDNLNLKYISTFQIENGLVFYAFERLT